MIALLPKMELLSDEALTPLQREAIEKYLLVPLNTLAKELPVTEERKVVLESIIASEQQWIQSVLNLSVEKRLPSLDNFHFYHGQEAEIIGQEHEQAEGWTGFSMGAVSYLVEQKFPSETLATVVHELTHLFSYNEYKLAVKGTFSFARVRSGYKSPLAGSYHGINEAITEMITIEVREFCRPRGILTGSSILFSPLVIYIDLLIKHSAKKKGCDAKSLRHQLYKGYFTGDVSSLALFDVCGKRISNNLITLDSSTGNLVVDRDYAHILEQRISKYETGKEITILDGIRVKMEEP